MDNDKTIEQVNETSPNGKPHLTNKDLNTIWLRRAFTHLSSMSYEKLQGHAYAWSYIPFANKYYSDNPEAKRRLLTRHSVFFNTEPQTGQIINGIVTSMEENIALGGEVSEEMPNNIKATLMGPLAGIGDSIIQGIIVPTLLSIGMSLANGGSPLGPLFYIVAYGILGPVISFVSYRTGYKLGVGAIDLIVGDNARRIMDAFNILGVMVIGALAAGNIALATTINIPLGGNWAPLQDTLNGVFPGLLPLAAVLLTWWMLGKKQFSPTKVIVILTIAISGLCLLGVF